uniref:7-dehydrocholesterol reductase n=1 Tax=Ascaris lumbricoides TaxID=6252 RepID=A0A9J2P6T4_ASCLU
MLRNNRRSSLGGSSLSISSRKSSVNPKDIERIQAAKRRQISSQLIICILITSPIFIFCYNCAIIRYEGSMIKLLTDFFSGRLVFSHILPMPTNSTAWKVLIFVVLLQFVFSLVLPYDSVIVLNNYGEREWRKLNGFWSCVLVVLLYIMGASLGFYKGAVICSCWTEILSLLNTLSFILAIILYMKFQLNEPSPLEAIYDIFYGSELAPTMFDVDVKHFLTYRVAFTIWPLYIISSLYYSYSLHGRITDGLVACSALQLTYIAKTQWLEHLHFSRLDAQVDKAGFYRIWGALVFMPALYLTPVTVMAKSGISLPLPVCLLLFIAGLMSIYITADIDRQRFNFRHANGNVKVWGKDPFFISAKFKRDNGEVGTNLLLGSGWWGLSRHLNYAVEWLTFASWTILPGSLTFLHYLPLTFLAIFLWMRMVQDESRCLAKYGHGWIQYKNRVPFLIIPSLY